MTRATTTVCFFLTFIQPFFSLGSPELSPPPLFVAHLGASGGTGSGLKGCIKGCPGRALTWQAVCRLPHCGASDCSKPPWAGGERQRGIPSPPGGQRVLSSMPGPLS